MTASRGRSIFLIREQDPLKQGLKLEVDEETIIKEITCSNIREQDPLKQGLKPKGFIDNEPAAGIREQDPLKQGLKQVFLYQFRTFISYSRARSIKTRIETRTS